MPYVGRSLNTGEFKVITLSESFDGNRVDFTMSESVGNVNQLIVILSGVVQHWTDAFTVSGTTLTFSSAPANGETIKILKLGDTNDIGVPSDASVTADKLASTLNLSSKTLTLPASSVTAHVTQFDDSAIRADISALALREATNEASAAFNLPNSFIDTFATDVLGTKTNVSISSGYCSTGTSGNCFTNDSNTKFLLQSNTTNGSTTFTDESSLGSTINSAGDVQHKTDQFKNGTSSIYFDGSSSNQDKLWTSDIQALEDLNNGDFCVEMWLRKPSSWTPTNHNVLTLGTEYQWEWSSGKLGFYNYEAFGDWTHTNEQSASSSDAWHHYASVRQGNNHRFYVDGTQTEVNSASTSSSFNNGVMSLGYHQSDTARAFQGWLDSIRISNVNRYPDGTGFTPPIGVSTNATGTAIQAANTVGSAKTEVSGTMIYKDNAGTATLGTDLKIYFTCNGGSNWTEAASYNAITPVYATGIKQVRLGKTTCTSGTDIRYKAVWANQASGSKETQLHGISINY